MFMVTKTYGHDLGLSACFRQWRANSHCNMLHGYALAFELTFAAERLNAQNWVIDFGALKPIKQLLVETFDHKTLVAEDDPELPLFKLLYERQVIDGFFMPRVGCEAFAEWVGRNVEEWLDQEQFENNPSIVRVKCSEHGANSASWINMVENCQ